MRLRGGLLSLLFLMPLFGQTAVTSQNQTDAEGPESGSGAGVAAVIKPSGEDRPNEWRRLVTIISGDQKAIWTSPFRMSKGDAKWFLLFGGATGALIATDHWTSRQLPNTEDQISVGAWTSRLGAAYSLAPITAAFWTYGRLADDGRARETGRLGMEALLNAALINTVVKAATQRERPTEGDGRGRFWKGKGRSWNTGSSFPSGHSTYGWALASLFAHEYSDKKWAPFVAYGLATTVSGSRFATRKHFASDIILGAGIGWFIGHYVYGKRHNSGVSPRKPGVFSWMRDHVTIAPTIGFGQTATLGPGASGSSVFPQYTAR